MKKLAALAAALAMALPMAVLAQTTPPPATSPAPTAPVERTLPAPSTDTMTMTEEQAKTWLKKRVYSSDGQHLGEVEAVSRDSSGRVVELHADIGGFLGIGETRVRVMPAQFRLDTDRVVLNVTAEQAKSLPAIAK